MNGGGGGRKEGKRIIVEWLGFERRFFLGEYGYRVIIFFYRWEMVVDWGWRVILISLEEIM